MRKFELPKIYPITDRRISGLSHAEQVEKLIAGGARIIQLREKHLAPKDFYSEAEKVLAFARPRNVKIIINDRVDLALTLKADGIHLGQDDLPPAEARKILGESAIIGFSTHSVEQAIAAVKFPVDYIAIGPIFETSTKENPDAVIGIEGLRQVRETIGAFPLVAIGGITKENARLCLEAGADSVAVISCLLNEPEQIAEKTIELICELQDSCLNECFNNKN
ncbi:MAG TPA: thiamine phosphate synthase, partial [Pyrinomonadaceae bacterium]|nr:thiamine phosphate synthase [Pyrinomonadaceae bacterium]